MDKNGVLGEILESGQQAASNATKGLKQTASDFAHSATGQVTGDGTGTNEDLNKAQTTMSDDQAQQFLRDLYGKSKKDEGSEVGGEISQTPTPSGLKETAMEQNPVQKALGVTPTDPNAGKTSEEIAQIEALRKTLHGEYYESLTNPPKPPEEPVVEKLEREDKEERWELEEKEKDKPPPLAVDRAQKTEKYPGASG